MKFKSKSLSDRLARLFFGATAVLAAALLVVLFSPSTDGTAAAQTTAVQQFAAPGSTSFADVIEHVSPAVVNISVSKLLRPTAGAPFGNRPGPEPFDEFFQRFFGVPGAGAYGQAPQRAEGQGSGFIIDSEGLVATNYHVIDGADEVSVTLNSGRTLEAHVVGSDERTDLALLRVESEDELPALQFGDSDGARVGDWVVAIGNPFGLGGTATAGIISARGRDIQSGPYDDYLQIDAPINSGNSGGPVFNASGQVIGINTAIFSPNGGNIGIGFAIPSNQARRVLAELGDAGSVSRGWLGVQIQSVDEDLAAALGLDGTEGALIADVVAKGPADRAGFHVGDVVVEFDGQPVDSARTLGRFVGARATGEDVTLGVWRDGRQINLEVELGELDDAPTLASTTPAERSAAPAQYGLTLEDLTPSSRTQLGLEAGAVGALVREVQPGSPAAAQGLRPGDVIIAVNRKSIDSARALADALAAGSDGDRKLLLVRRGDSQRFVALGLA